MWSRFKSTCATVWSGAKTATRYFAASSVSVAKSVAGAGQANFNQDRFDNYAGIQSSWISYTLKGISITGTFIAIGFTRAPRIFKDFISEKNNLISIEEEKTFIAKCRDFILPPDLNWKGRLLYLLLTPLNVLSVVFQSISIIGFTTNLMQFIVPLLDLGLSRLLNQTTHVPADPEVIAHDSGVYALCLYFFVFNGVSNISFDLRNAIANAHLFSSHIGRHPNDDDQQVPESSWGELCRNPAFVATIGTGLISSIPVPLLAQVSTYNNLGKIPFIPIAESVRTAISWISAITSVVGHNTGKMPSFYRTLNGDVNKIYTGAMTPGKCALYVIFYTGIAFDIAGSGLANFTSVVTGFTPWVVKIFPNADITDKSAGMIAFAVVGGALNGGINACYGNEAFRKILEEPQSSTKLITATLESVRIDPDVVTQPKIIVIERQPNDAGSSETDSLVIGGTNSLFNATNRQTTPTQNVPAKNLMPPENEEPRFSTSAELF